LIVYSNTGWNIKYLLSIILACIYLISCNNNVGNVPTTQSVSNVSISYAPEIPILSSNETNQFGVMLYNDSDVQLMMPLIL